MYMVEHLFQIKADVHTRKVRLSSKLLQSALMGRSESGILNRTEIGQAEDVRNRQGYNTYGRDGILPNPEVFFLNSLLTFQVPKTIDLWSKGDLKIEESENILDYRYPLSIAFGKSSERMFIGDSLGTIY